MKRILLAALVGVLASVPVIAAELKEKPSGIPVLWVGDGKSFDTAIFFISARSQSEALLLDRHSPDEDDIQLSGNCTTGPPPRERHSFRSHPIA